MRITYNKLVRDNIPEIITSKGSLPITHVAADDNEYWTKLQEKLGEEYEEFTKDSNLEELADMIEVIYAICDFKHVRKEELEKIRTKKAKERGAFAKRIILDETN